MTKTKWKNAACVSCEKGTVKEVDLLGRPFNHGDEHDLVFDESLLVPVCDSCAEFYMNRSISHRFSKVLERLRAERKQRLVARFLETIERELPPVSRATWEEVFGLSRGYLSRLLTGARVPDTALALLLRRFTESPYDELEHLKAQRRLPPELARALEARRRRINPAAPAANIPAGPTTWLVPASMLAHEVRVATAPSLVREVSRITVDISTQPVAIYHNPTTGAARGSGTGPTQVGDARPTVLVPAA